MDTKAEGQVFRGREEGRHGLWEGIMGSQSEEEYEIELMVITENVLLWCNRDVPVKAREMEKDSQILFSYH